MKRQVLFYLQKVDLNAVLHFSPEAKNADATLALLEARTNLNIGKFDGQMQLKVNRCNGLREEQYVLTIQPFYYATGWRTQPLSVCIAQA
jgi:hypothetical protein